VLPVMPMEQGVVMQVRFVAQVVVKMDVTRRVTAVVIEQQASVVREMFTVVKEKISGAVRVTQNAVWMESVVLWKQDIVVSEGEVIMLMGKLTVMDQMTMNCVGTHLLCGSVLRTELLFIVKTGIQQADYALIMIIVRMN